MDTKGVIARFAAKRPALALMEHPTIAPVFDAGATETGRPYFVMELVRGPPITRYCDERTIPTAERLALFVQVCRAIQHAHEKGIVHRDIKPSSILVTNENGASQPKVIDFGIAKATQGRPTDKTLFTASEQFIGTPAYMSPELADFNAHDVDARSDVYSLGALLYELIVGRAPFDPKTRTAQGIDEVRRIVREVDLPRPSTQLHTLPEAEALVHRGRFADAEAMLVSIVPLLSSPSTPYSTGQRLWLALAQARQNRGETALKTLAPAKAALKRLREDMATADQREQQARLLFIEAIAQPDTEAGSEHRRAALAEVSRFLETLTEEASRLYYPRILQRWITEERARTL